MSKKNKRCKSTNTADRISDLPDAIIHQILSLLPTKDATQTSALPKAFYCSWISFPVIDLKNYLINKYSSKGCSSQEFIDLVNRTIQQHTLVEKVSIYCYLPAENAKASRSSFFRPQTIEHMGSITTLELTNTSLYHFNRMVIQLPVLKCLNLHSCHGLKHFKFSSTKIKSIYLDLLFGLDSVVIESPSLETLKLHRHNKHTMKIIDISECESLKNLFLSVAEIKDSWIKENLPVFAKLENLQLIECVWLENPRIVNDNLKSLLVYTECKTIPSIEIAATNLRSLSLDVLEGRSVNIISFMHLTDITLESSLTKELVMEFLAKQAPKFIQLETLKIYTMEWDLGGIEISNENLKRLFLSLSYMEDDFVEHDLVEITLNTPKLVSLKYTGCATAEFHKLNSMDLQDVQLKIDGYDYETDDYFVKLRNLIGTISDSKVLILSCSGHDEMFFSREWRQKLVPPGSDCEHVKVKLYRGWEKISVKFVKSILWLFPSLKTLCFISRGGGATKIYKSIKFVHDSRIREEDIDRKKHWRMSLRKVEFCNFDAVERAKLQEHFLKKAKSLDSVTGKQFDLHYNIAYLQFAEIG